MTTEATGDGWRSEVRNRLAEVLDGDELHDLSSFCFKKSKDFDSDPESRLEAAMWWLGTAAFEERAWRQVSLAEAEDTELQRLRRVRRTLSENGGGRGHPHGPSLRGGHRCDVLGSQVNSHRAEGMPVNWRRSIDVLPMARSW